MSLAGCALTTTATPELDRVAGASIGGQVHGGQQPLTGARIYLLAANPAGYGSASLSLLTAAGTGNPVDSIGSYQTSNGVGVFDITSQYSCTTGYAQGASTASGGTILPGNEQVYLYVLGGNPGLGSGTNSNVGMLAALGPCNAQIASFVQVNEITTAAAAYAFAGFATDATHLSSSGSALALTGLTNAGLTSQNLANVATGLPPSTTLGRNGFPPSQNIISIANILSSCINGATGNSYCSSLFQYTKSAGATGTSATDTASAAINLAHNPYPTAAGMTALYGLVTASPAFAGGLASQPSDFTLGITFTGGGFANSTANGLAIDASGNVFSTSGNRLCKFSNTGAAISDLYGYTGGFYSAKSIAIDTLGNIWLPNLGINTLSEVSNNGTPISGSNGFSASANGGISTPLGVAIDALGSVWIANQNGSLSKFSSLGTPFSSSSGFTDGSRLVSYAGVAIDISGNAWATNTSNGSFSKFANSGTAITAANGYYGGGLGSPYGIAIDASGNVWASDYYNSALFEFSSGGTPSTPYGGYRGGGVNTPYSIAIDSSGRVWAADFNSNAVTAYSNSGTPLSPPYGYNSGSGTYGPVNVAIDGSGNVWVTDYNGGLTELIGAGSPVVTPMVANLVAPYGTATVNRP